MKSFRRIVGAGCFLASFLCEARAQSYDLRQPHKILPLANGLTEISGLEAASASSVYAHNDEHAIIYEVALEDGKIISAFAMGNPTIAADFEAIAAAQGRIYLITSDGLLYEAFIGPHQSRVKFNAYDTGVGSRCEVEGMSTGPDDKKGWPTFLILCKSPRQPELKDRITIFQWKLAERLPVKDPWMSIERDPILTKKDQKKFKPSGLHWDKEGGELTIISGRNQLFLRLTSSGDLLSKERLSSERHQQTEGVVIMHDGRLILADEGLGLAPASLTLYEPAP